MARDGSRGPRPYDQRRHSTVFLPVPARDWPAVIRGHKTEFRSNARVPQLFHVQTPTAVVAYTVRRGEHDARLMVLEALWQEPLGAISPESLANEGFATLDEYRSYWVARERRRFTPTRNVFAYRVRRFEPEDTEPLAMHVFQHLYGEFLPA